MFTFLDYIEVNSDYKTAFNKGKQQEVEMRIKHSRNIPNWRK
jgi:hypothetical protein